MVPWKQANPKTLFHQVPWFGLCGRIQIGSQHKPSAWIPGVSEEKAIVFI